MPKNKKLNKPIKKLNGGMTWPKMPSFGFGSNTPSTPIPTNQGSPPSDTEAVSGSSFTPSPPNTPYPGETALPVSVATGGPVEQSPLQSIIPIQSIQNISKGTNGTGEKSPLQINVKNPISSLQSIMPSMSNIQNRFMGTSESSSPNFMGTTSKILQGPQGQSSALPGSSPANFMSTATQLINPGLTVQPSAPPISLMNLSSSVKSIMNPMQSMPNPLQTSQRANCPPCPTQNCNRPVDYSILSTISKFIEDGRLNERNLSPKLFEKN